MAKKKVKNGKKSAEVLDFNPEHDEYEGLNQSQIDHLKRMEEAEK